ncbi:hypothetical protein EMIHUDRAFT_442714 [Emiliania huxleyi CCMP1516]|uniref:EF-hand domain-containing protein n=2 Tax=Emiliania huxleyi TaxID=2903 RepID=A0A0D3K1V0_EMIH1|nr:hypothetical protein EMIHUDRAFT_442714 [Emiliania huxleyi CCMP1516]EOD29735.1 hypothetical protein EMIHUDRAFT_442714 [Emiliania huxleyi CCMP1516]|eukprot:XP_005782164.1 hypothetical protein EMIHUDRAFT_442714 [Emiliania huxleyi CCMP1516]
MAAFREYDSDADGFLTPPEVLTFLQGHGLHYVADRAFVPVDDNVQFGDFKSLLLDTCILSLYASDGKIQLSKEVPLMDKVCEEFFRGADLDGNFVISPQDRLELEVLFGRIHMASHAGTYYAVYAKEGYGGGISMDGFKHMLLGEAPEASYHDEVLTAAEYQHESFNSYRH